MERDGDLTGVVTDKGEKLPADLLVVTVPQVPSLEYLEGSALVSEEGVLVDETLRTSRENIFAAGDVVNAMSPAALSRWLKARPS